MGQVSSAIGFGALLLSCERTPESAEPAAKPQLNEVVKNYDLSCDTLSNGAQERVLCARMNTSTGDTKLMELKDLPTLQADAVTEPRGAGRYSVTCVTYRNQSASFACLRLDQVSGEVALLPVAALSK